MPTPEGLAQETSLKFTELYNRASGSSAKWTLGPQGSRAGPRVINVQQFTSNKLDAVCRVTICTIQRLYAMLSEFCFRLEKDVLHGDLAQGDGQRVVRVQRRVRAALPSLPRLEIAMRIDLRLHHADECHRPERQTPPRVT
jgi:hypothetical protein